MLRADRGLRRMKLRVPRRFSSARLLPSTKDADPHQRKHHRPGECPEGILPYHLRPVHPIELAIWGEIAAPIALDRQYLPWYCCARVTRGSGTVNRPRSGTRQGQVHPILTLSESLRAGFAEITGLRWLVNLLIHIARETTAVLIFGY
jgi:hypothetical protein